METNLSHYHRAGKARAGEEPVTNQHTIVTFPIRAGSCVPAGKISQMETVGKHSHPLKLSSFILQNIPKGNSQACTTGARTRWSTVSWITLKPQKQPRCPAIRDWVDKWREFIQWHVIGWSK